MTATMSATKDWKLYQKAFEISQEPPSLSVENLRKKRNISALSKQIQKACGLIPSILSNGDRENKVLLPSSGNTDFAVSEEDFDYIISRPHTQELGNLIWCAFAEESISALNRLSLYLASQLIEYQRKGLFQPLSSSILKTNYTKKDEKIWNS